MKLYFSSVTLFLCYYKETEQLLSGLFHKKPNEPGARSPLYFNRPLLQARKKVSVSVDMFHAKIDSQRRDILSIDAVWLLLQIWCTLSLAINAKPTLKVSAFF